MGPNQWSGTGAYGPVNVSPEQVPGESEEPYKATVRAFETFEDAVRRLQGEIEALLREINRGPRNDGVRYFRKHEGPNRRERRAAERGKELPDWEPERSPSPGRRAFRNRDIY